jgi:hypothetical protein
LAKDMETALKFPKLKRFSLREERITEEVLAAIKRIKGLEKLSFTNTNMTTDSAVALKGELPHVHLSLYREEPLYKDGPPHPTKLITVIELP